VSEPSSTPSSRPSADATSTGGEAAGGTETAIPADISTSPERTSPLLERRANSRSAEFRVARIAAIAGICGALLGAAGTLIASNNQIVAADKLSSDGFLREQRRSAYAQLIEADQRLQQVEQDCVRDIFEAAGFAIVPPSDAELDQIHVNLSEAYPGVMEAAANVQLVAPPRTAQLASELAKTQSVSVAGMSQLTRNQYVAAAGKSPVEIKDDLARSYAAYESFVAAAREDLLPT